MLPKKTITERSSAAIFFVFFVTSILFLGCATPRKSASQSETRARADRALSSLDTTSEGIQKEADDSFSERSNISENISADRDAIILNQDPSGCTWVDAKASVSFGDNDTKHQAKAQAISEARAKAMNDFLGVNLQHHFIDFQQEGLKGEISLTESLLRVTQLGRVLNEKVLSAGPQDVKDCYGCRYSVHIQTCIMPRSDQFDKEFKVILKLNRTVYINGDESTIQITSNRDAYIYIYSVDMDWNASLIFPNDLAKENKIKVGETLIFPDEDVRKKGLRLIAQIPEKTTASAEMIRVIASKSPLPPSLLDLRRSLHRSTRETMEGSSFLILLQNLNAQAEEWVEDVQAFTIYEK